MIRQEIELLACDARMVGGTIAVIPDPRDDPGGADDAERDKRSAPRDQCDQGSDDRRRHRVAEPRKGVRDALREAAALDRRPTLHRPRRAGKRRAFAKTEQEPKQKE